MANVTFNFTATRPGPPPTTVVQTFGHQLGLLIVNLESKNYSGITYSSKVDESNPAGPSAANASVNCIHAFPFALVAELPEQLFITLYTTAAAQGWVIADRVIVILLTP